MELMSVVIDLRRLHRSALWQLRIVNEVLTRAEKYVTLQGDRSAGDAGNEELKSRVGAGRQLELLEEYEKYEICATSGG